jgi:L-fuconolactonase
LFIVDSQAHIWGAPTPQRPWPLEHNPPHRPGPYTKDDLLLEMDTAGVSRAILVPPTFEGGWNDLVLEAARLHPQRFAAMGRVAMDIPKNQALIPDWKAQPGMMGLRVTVTSPKQKLLITDGTADWFWAEAERANLPLMVNFAHDLLPNIANIAERYPGLKLAIDHFGLSIGTKDEAAFAVLPQIFALAKWPNISVKVSALPCYVSDKYPYPSLHKHIRRAYDAFGPERMFWGSDFTRLPCPYLQAITLFTEELPWLEAKDQEWIMGRALCKWLNWPATSPEASH